MSNEQGTDQNKDAEQLRKYKKNRATIKGQFTRLRTLLVSKEDWSLTELEIRLNSIRDYWDKYDKLQDSIDDVTDESAMTAERDYRYKIEDDYIDLKKDLITMIAKMNKPKEQPGTSSTTNISHVQFTPYQQEESFRNFIKRFENYCKLRGNTGQTTKVYLLINALTPQIHEKLSDLCAPVDPDSKNYDEIVKILVDYYDPQPSVWALQHKFISRLQTDHEPITEFVSELKKGVAKCEFKFECGKSVADFFLRLQFIRGVRDPEIRVKLLQEHKAMSFQEAVNIATTIELSKSENTDIIEQSKIGTKVHQMKNKSNTTGGPRREPNQVLDFEALKGRCYRCGDKDHRANKCRFSKATCNFCSKIGHISKVCLAKTMKQGCDTKQIDTDQESTEERESYEINLVSNNRNLDKFNINLKIEHENINMELDTGAALSTMSLEDFEHLKIKKKIHETRVQLRTYTGELIKPEGVVYVTCKYKNQSFIGKLYLIKQKVDPIFGREWMREVRLDWAEIRAVKEEATLELDTLFDNYKDVFAKDEIGVIPNMTGHLYLNNEIQPIFLKARQVPFAIKPKVEMELERLEKLGIITKVEQSDWGTPIVPVVKPNGSIRICADYKTTVNRRIKDEQYPIPLIEEIFTKMNGGKFFCTLDLSNAYLHLLMDDESALIQTLSTHRGLYKVNRLMFGVKVAPAIWNRFMDKVLHGLDGVASFFDDIIIQGKTLQETMQRLTKVLDRLRQYNLKLNKDKCSFFKRSIKYLGHVIDENGLHTSKDKVEALVKAKRPENVSELKSFLGLANYYNKFIRNLATILNPLNKLLKKSATFKWNQKCEKSFCTVKEEIASDNTLVHFNPQLPLVLATDASPVVLGAVLSHRLEDGSDRPIAFASRTLTKTEQQYSQIDKEATGIFWGLKKFFPYCYGRKFILITDHKPLVSIFNPTKPLPTMTATRLFNYSNFLSGFYYTVEFRKIPEHSNADFLSWFPNEQCKDSFKDDPTIFCTTIANNEG